MRTLALLLALSVSGCLTIVLSPDDDLVRRMGVLETDTRTQAQNIQGLGTWAETHTREVDQRLDALEATPTPTPEAAK